MQTLVIAIVSAKGGVGKTTTAINLAQGLHDFSRNVIVVDGNYTKPNIGLQLGVTKHDVHINHVLQGHKHIHDSYYTHYSGLQVIPGSIIYEEACGKNTRKFADIIDDLRGRFEVVIIDTAPTFGHELYDVLDAVDHAILVTKTDLSSITDTLRTKKLCEDKHVNVMGAVITHTSKEDQAYSISEIHSFMNSPIIGEIPFDKNIDRSHGQKLPLVFMEKDSPASIGYKRLAANLIGETYESEKEISAFKYVLMRLGLR